MERKYDGMLLTPDRKFFKATVTMDTDKKTVSTLFEREYHPYLTEEYIKEHPVLVTAILVDMEEDFFSVPWPGKELLRPEQ